MRRIFTLMSLLLATILATGSTAKETQVFIVAGQSNALGAGGLAGLPNDLRRQPDVRYWYYTNRGNTRNKFQDLAIVGSTFGPELNLGRVLADTLDDEIAIVKVAQPGTELAKLIGRTDWSPNSQGELYDRLIQNVNNATAKIVSLGDTPHLAGIFWMQGESDGKSGNLVGGGFVPPQPETANAYESNLNHFIAELRTDLNVPELPFFIGEINIGDDPSVRTVPDSNYNTRFGEWGLTPTIQAAEAAVAAADPRTHLIKTQQFSLLSDFLHFDRAGQLDLGEAFAKAYLATVPEPSSCCLLLASVMTLFGFKRSH